VVVVAVVVEPAAQRARPVVLAVVVPVPALSLRKLRRRFPTPCRLRRYLPSVESN